MVSTRNNPDANPTNPTAAADPAAGAADAAAAANAAAAADELAPDGILVDVAPNDTDSDTEDPEAAAARDIAHQAILRAAALRAAAVIQAETASLPRVPVIQPGQNWGAPLPPQSALRFSLTPFGRILHYDRASDNKLYSQASAHFATLFDGDALTLIAFADQVHTRAIQISCRDIFNVPVPTALPELTETRDILKMWTSISTEQARTAALARWARNDWYKQSAYILGQAILDSTTSSFRARLIQHRAQYEMDGTFPDAALLMKTIFGLVYVETEQTAFNLKEELNNMHLKDFGNDVVAMHTFFNNKVNRIAATNEALTDHDKITYLLRIYKTAGNEQLDNMLEQIKNVRRSFGTSFDLMRDVELRYHELLQTREWGQPSKNQQLLALKAETLQLKEENKALRSPKSIKPSIDPAWKLIPPETGKEHELITKDRREWAWCLYHKSWVLHESRRIGGTHTSATCRLNPANANSPNPAKRAKPTHKRAPTPPKSSKQVKIDARFAATDADVMDSSSASE